MILNLTNGHYVFGKPIKTVEVQASYPPEIWFIVSTMGPAFIFLTSSQMRQLVCDLI